MEQEIRQKLGLLTPTEVAGSLDVTEHTLAVWRSGGRGPKFVRLGRGIFYRFVDLQAWIDDNVVVALAEADA